MQLDLFTGIYLVIKGNTVYFKWLFGNRYRYLDISSGTTKLFFCLEILSLEKTWRLCPMHLNILFYLLNQNQHHFAMITRFSRIFYSFSQRCPLFLNLPLKHPWWNSF